MAGRRPTVCGRAGRVRCCPAVDVERPGRPRCVRRPRHVVLVSTAFLVVPLRLIIGGMREVMSMSPPEDVQSQLRAAVDEVGTRYGLEESFVRAAKVGGRMDIEVDYLVGPESRVVTVADCDAARSDLHERLAALGYEKSVVVAFTTDRRWAE